MAAVLQPIPHDPLSQCQPPNTLSIPVVDLTRSATASPIPVTASPSTRLQSKRPTPIKLARDPARDSAFTPLPSARLIDTPLSGLHSARMPLLPSQLTSKIDLSSPTSANSYGPFSAGFVLPPLAPTPPHCQTPGFIHFATQAHGEGRSFQPLTPVEPIRSATWPNATSVTQHNEGGEPMSAPLPEVLPSIQSLFSYQQTAAPLSAVIKRSSQITTPISPPDSYLQFLRRLSLHAETPDSPLRPNWVVSPTESSASYHLETCSGCTTPMASAHPNVKSHPANAASPSFPRSALRVRDGNVLSRPGSAVSGTFHHGAREHSRSCRVGYNTEDLVWPQTAPPIEGKRFGPWPVPRRSTDEKHAGNMGYSCEGSRRESRRRSVRWAGNNSRARREGVGSPLACEFAAYAEPLSARMPESERDRERARARAEARKRAQSSERERLTSCVAPDANPVRDGAKNRKTGDREMPKTAEILGRDMDRRPRLRVETRPSSFTETWKRTVVFGAEDSPVRGRKRTRA